MIKQAQETQRLQGQEGLSAAGPLTYADFGSVYGACRVRFPYTEWAQVLPQEKARGLA